MINETSYVLNSKCNQCCKGCYLEFQRQYPERDHDQALLDLKVLSDNSRQIFLTGSDILSYENVETLFPYSNQTLVLGNVVSVPRRRKVLEAISRNSNVKFVMLTSPSSTNIQTDNNAPSLVKDAVVSVKESGLEPVLTFVIGLSNYQNLEAFADEAIENEARYARFIRHMPLNKEYGPNFLDDSHMEGFLSQIRMLRKKIPKNILYIRVDGLFGTEWRKEKGKTCSAGQNDFLIGLDNKVYPCEFLAKEEFILGKFENGVINLERKLIGLSDYDCKAKQIFGDGKKPIFAEVDERI
jgi:MoaA/NifB/PqqE/SkfB family radical SAM enzyme